MNPARRAVTELDLDPPPSTDLLKLWLALERTARRHAGILVLLLLSAGIYSAVAAYQWLDLDEGVYLDSANAIVHGIVPFINFPGREPVISYYLALGVAIFGPNLLVGRLQIVLVDLITGVGLYALGRDLRGPAAGVAMAAFFLLNPFDVYYNTLIILEPTALAPLVWVAYLCLRKRPPTSTAALLGIGFLLAIAELARRDSVILLPIVLFALLLRAPVQKLSQVRQVVLPTLSFLAGTGAVLGAFAYRTSIQWVWSLYGIGQASNQSGVPLDAHLGALSYALVCEPVLVIPACIAVGAALVSWGYRAIGSGLLAGLGALILIGYWCSIAYFSWGQGEYLYYGAPLLIVLSVLLWRWGSSASEVKGARSDPFPKLFTLYMSLWAGSIALFYTFVYPQFFTHYLIEISAPLGALAGLWWTAVIPRYVQGGEIGTDGPPKHDKVEQTETSAGRPASRGRLPTTVGVTAVGLTVLLLSSGAFSAIMVLGPSNAYNQPLTYGLSETNILQAMYSPTEIKEVASYVDSITPANATVFSADSIFVAVADRHQFENLSIIIDDYAYRSFALNQSPLPYDPFNLAPTMSEILQKWNRTWIPVVIVGNRMRSMESAYPYLVTYIAAHYFPVAYFGNQLAPWAVQVWALGTPPTGANLLGSLAQANDTSNIVVSPLNGTILVAQWNSSLISAVSPIGSDWSIALPKGFSGVRALAFSPDGTTLWVGLFGYYVAIYSFTPGLAPSLLALPRVGGTPAHFGFDQSRSTALVLNEYSSTVSEINESTGAVELNFSVLGSPAALAMNPGSGILAVSSGASAEIATYWVENGSLLSQFSIPAPANNLAFVGSLLYATSWNPGMLYALNSSSGDLEREYPTGPETEGFYASDSVLAVGSVGSDRVSLFAPLTGNPVGSFYTNTCVSTLAMTPSNQSETIFAGGPCGQNPEVWHTRPLLNFTVRLPSGSALTLDGSPVVQPAALSILPGIYQFNLTAPGYAPEGFSIAISSAGSWSPTFGPGLAAVQAIQYEFAAGVLVCVLVIYALVVAFLSRPSRTFPPTKTKPRRQYQSGR